MQIAGEYATLGAARAADVDADAILLGSSPGLEDAEGPSIDEPLTPREIEVLELLAEGLRSNRTVDHRVAAILRRLDVRTRGEASAQAVSLGLTA